MYMEGAMAAKANTTLPCSEMSSRNCKGAWSVNSVSAPPRSLPGAGGTGGPQVFLALAKPGPLKGVLWPAPKELGAWAEAVCLMQACSTPESHCSQERCSPGGMWFLHMPGLS